MSETLLLNTGMISLRSTRTESSTRSVKGPASNLSMSAVTTSHSRPHLW